MGESNKISGQIPWGLAKNINLNYLGLANNNFNGDVPWQFNLFLNLSTLTLHNNNLSGEIDDKLCFIRTITADCLAMPPRLTVPAAISAAEEMKFAIPRDYDGLT